MRRDVYTAMTLLWTLIIASKSLQGQATRTLPSRVVGPGEVVLESAEHSLTANSYVIQPSGRASFLSSRVVLNPGFRTEQEGQFLARGFISGEDPSDPDLPPDGGGPGGGDVMGSTAGSFTVNESGAATYTIPLTLPPGTAGMAPELALAYSSMGGNGLLGIGWTLKGLSSISRTGATLAQDGLVDGVDFDGLDRLVLDGERLMVVSGTYGAAGSEYRTEQDTFKKVVAYGQQGSGPQYFTVWTKDGLIYEYGHTADARLEAQGRVEAMVWSVSRITDTKGNYIQFTYTEDTSITHQRIRHIEYTGNNAVGLSPYCTVAFEYENRPDAVPSYLAGSLVRNPYRLKKVLAKYRGSTARSYTLHYETGGATKRSHLTALQECGSDGTCFEATTLGWASPTESSISENFNGPGSGYWQGHSGGQYNNVVADFNGDGLADMAGYAGNGSWHVTLSTGAGFNGSGSGYGRAHD